MSQEINPKKGLISSLKVKRIHLFIHFEIYDHLVKIYCMFSYKSVLSPKIFHAT